MTDEELDRARALEADRQRFMYGSKSVPEIAARLAREGWMPPDPLADHLARLRRDLGIKWDDDAKGMDYLRAALVRGIEIGREQRP